MPRPWRERRLESGQDAQALGAHHLAHVVSETSKPTSRQQAWRLGWFTAFWIVLVFACVLAPEGRTTPTALLPASLHTETSVPLVICDVFGDRYCAEALRVSWCESRFHTTARNGQYLGLFQMGSSERRRYGHGQSARAQSIAAHRYFVASGKDWSPWSCSWAA